MLLTYLEMVNRCVATCCNVSGVSLKVLLADRKVEAPCNAHGVFIIICEV